MISMTANQQGTRFERVIPLAGKQSVSIEAGGEIEPGQLELAILNPRLVLTVALDRAEARAIAYHMIEATQWMWERGEG
jgi:hypothetical protein